MITLKSHGFKYSRPDTNIVFDVSYFVNPWRDETIRNETNPAQRRKVACESFPISGIQRRKEPKMSHNGKIVYYGGTSGRLS